MSNVTNNKNELYKTTIAIRFNLLEVCLPLPPFLIAFIFIPSLNVLNGYFYVSLNLVAFLTVLMC